MEGMTSASQGSQTWCAGAFAFLESAGFSESEQGPTIVRFKRGELECNVYVGRRSGELGFQIGHDHEQFSMSALIRLRDPTLADKYRNLVPADLSELQTGIEKLAALVREFVTGLWMMIQGSLPISGVRAKRVVTSLRGRSQSAADQAQGGGGIPRRQVSGGNRSVRRNRPEAEPY